MKKADNLIKVGGHTIGVFEEDIQSMGEYFRETSVIRIKTGLSGDQFYTTLLHEVLHHIWGEAGLRGVLGDDLEERIVVAFEQGLFSFITDNPELIGAMIVPKKKKKKQKKKIKTKKVSY